VKQLPHKIFVLASLMLCAAAGALAEINLKTVTPRELQA